MKNGTYIALRANENIENEIQINIESKYYHTTYSQRQKLSQMVW